MPYNILSCKGFVESAGTGLNFGPCFQAKIAIVFLFFIGALIGKWGGEEFGLPFGKFSAWTGGILSYLVAVSLTGNVKFSFLIGFVLMLVSGYIGAVTWEGDGGGY